jgi:hypothetical protein
LQGDGIVKALPIIAAALLLTACQKPKTADPDAAQKAWAGGVARAAVAPDGTTLWVTVWRGDYIFFASSGSRWQTHRTEARTDGKGRTHTETITEDHAVPTAGGIDAVSRDWSDQ